MMYMLDTNVIVRLMRRNPEIHLVRRVAAHLGNDLCISVITLGELMHGCMKSEDPEYNILKMYQTLAGIHVLDFDSFAALEFGRIITYLERNGLRIGDRDMQIAAHAKTLKCTLVTHNTREFIRVPDLFIEDWQGDLGH